MDYSDYEHMMADPGFLAHAEGLLVSTENNFIELMGFAFNAKYRIEIGEHDRSMEQAIQISDRLASLNQLEMVHLVTLLLDQMVDQIHARMAPDGDLSALHDMLAGKEVSPYLGRASSWFLGKEES